MANQTPIPRQELKIIAIQQQPKAKSPQTVIFDIYRVKSTAPQNSDFSLSNEQQTSDFKRAIACQHLISLGYVICTFSTTRQTLVVIQTGRNAYRETLAIKSHLSQFDINSKNLNNPYKEFRPIAVDCPIPNPLTDAQKLDFQKDMFNYTVLRNVEAYAIDKKSQIVSYFRTYFISEMPNGWEQIHYQLNPNEYPFAYSKIV